MSAKSDMFNPFAEGNNNGNSNSTFTEPADDVETADEEGVEEEENLNHSSFDNSGNLFDTTFDSSVDAFDFGPPIVKRLNSASIDFDLTGGMLKGTRSASREFHFPDAPAGAVSGGNGGGADRSHDIDEDDNDDNVFFSKLSADNKHEVPVKIALHEEMSCVFDGVSRTSSLSIEGTISVKSSVALEGKEFRFILKDPEQHVDKLSFDSSFVSEADASGGGEGGVKRVFGVTLPNYGLPSNTDIQMVKYACSSSLAPVPVLVQSKVRIAGKLCRVAVKVRSNPSNKHNLCNVAVLLAIPPDLNGETVKMNRKGGIWDGMKRMIVWPCRSLKPGQMLEYQAQMEFNSILDARKKNQESALPKFPVLVRFDSKEDQLSSVDLVIGDPNADDFVFEEFKLSLKRTFRVLHRKV